MTRHHLRYVRHAVATATLAALTVVLPWGATAAHADSGVDKKITRAEVIARAQYWVYVTQPDYSMTGSATDILGKSYRTDCSGFVDMAWHLSDQPNTGDLMSSTYTTSVASLDAMLPGDLLDDDVTSGGDPSYPFHAILFAGWNDSAHTTFTYYSFGGAHPVRVAAATPTGDQANSGSWSSHPVGDYKKRRYIRIMNDTAGTEAATPPAGGSCATTGWLVIAIPNRTDIEISEDTCLYHGVSYPDGQALYWAQAWITVHWKPVSGTSSIDGYLNNLDPHVQLQLNDVTSTEARCELANNMTDADGSGSRTCLYTLYSPASGSWTADGWVDFDVNGDGKYALGPHYLAGSPAWNH
jgi:hypothetical protein